MLDVLRALLPRPWKKWARSAQIGASQASSSMRKRLIFGKLAPLVPPEILMHDGPPTYREFKRNAEEFFNLYLNLCGLQRHERILDVGCGIGRKAILLTTYLDAQASYEGIDIVKTGIDWCSRHISTKHPHFRFQLIDVFNRHYNPSGKKRASDYSFPFADGSFDFVTLSSVFTHMLPADTENYLAQVRRMLGNEGRCLISWFLLNDESLQLIRAGKSTLPFIHRIADVAWTTNRDDPEAAVAYDEAYVQELYRRCGLAIRERIHYGSWCGRTQFLSYQDLILASPRHTSDTP